MLTRFAPSPTGLLHLGHAYAAKFAFDLAQQHGGTFLLRFEDIDTTRVRAEYYDAIQQDLTWLGLSWDETPVCQLDRLPAYMDALEQLKSMGVVSLPTVGGIMTVTAHQIRLIVGSNMARLST